MAALGKGLRALLGLTGKEAKGVKAALKDPPRIDPAAQASWDRDAGILGQPLRVPDRNTPARSIGGRLTYAPGKFGGVDRISPAERAANADAMFPVTAYRGVKRPEQFGGKHGVEFYHSSPDAASSYADRGIDPEYWDERGYDIQPYMVKGRIDPGKTLEVDAGGRAFDELSRDSLIDASERGKFDATRQKFTGSWRPPTPHDFVNHAKAGGYDTVTFKNMRDEPTMRGDHAGVEPGTVYAVINPAKRRASTAAFDPAKRASKDLLASVLLGTGVAGGATMLGSQKEAEAINIGPLAKTWDKALGEKAIGMVRGGVPERQVFKETGLFRDAGGNWGKEIDDSAMMAKEGHGRLGDLVDHPELFRAYPELAEELALLQRGGSGGGWWDETGRYAKENGDQRQYSLFASEPSWASSGKRSDGHQLRSVAGHELQHAVDSLEARPYGSKRYNAFLGMSDPEYKNNISEVRARNTQTRLNMTPEERAASYPPDTEDVPFYQQILRERPDVSREAAPNFLAEALLGTGIAGAATAPQEAKASPLSAIAGRAADAAKGAWGAVTEDPVATALAAATLPAKMARGLYDDTIDAGKRTLKGDPFAALEWAEPTGFAAPIRSWLEQGPPMTPGMDFDPSSETGLLEAAIAKRAGAPRRGARAALARR